MEEKEEEEEEAAGSRQQAAPSSGGTGIQFKVTIICGRRRAEEKGSIKGGHNSRRHMLSFPTCVTP